MENATTHDTMLGHARNLEPRQALVKHMDGGLALEGAVAVDPVFLGHVGLIGEGLSTCCSIRMVEIM